MFSLCFTSYHCDAKKIAVMKALVEWADIVEHLTKTGIAVGQGHRKPMILGKEIREFRTWSI